MTDRQVAGGRGTVRARRRPARRGDAPDRHPAGVLLVCAVVAGTQMSWGLVVPVLPVYADVLDADAAALGLAVAAFGLGRLVIDVPAGALVGRVDGRWLLATAVACVAAATLLTAVVPSVGWLVAARLATGLAGGVAITTGQALLAAGDPERLGRTMGALQAYQLAGGAMGPVLGGVLVAADPRLPFLAGGSLLVVLAVVTLLRSVPAPHPTPVEDSPADVPPPLLTRGLVAVCAVGFTVFLVRFGGQHYLFPVLAYERAGLTPAQLGAAIAATTVLGLLLVRTAGRLTDRRGRRPVVVATTAALALTTLGFLASSSAPAFLAALVLTGVATSFTGPPTGAFLAGSVAARRRGLAVGVYRTCGDAATLLGPVLLGWLLAGGRTTAAVVLLSVTTALAAALFAGLSRRPQAPVVRRRRRVATVPTTPTAPPAPASSPTPTASPARPARAGTP